ncbi:MAG: hypothetical protein HYV40_03565 [Candidatus Levybacteria bacterium]|nr:hypothetical protein [Candidatus Levybacteria bacterium]
MTPIANQNPKQKRKLPHLFDFDDESLESVREVVGGLSHTIGKDVVQDGAKDLWAQIVGKYEKTAQKADKLAGELQKGQELDLSKLHKPEKSPAPKRHDIAPGLDQYNYYREIARSSEKSSRQESYQMERQVEEILVEIKRLVDSSHVVEAEFKAIAVEQKPKEAGKYHVNFFEWVLISIRQARMRVEDSGAWLSAMASKKSKKNYWSMFKKHGTSFGMSNERTVATQTG